MSRFTTEAGFQDAIAQLAGYCGWRILHIRPARTKSGRYTVPVQYDGVGFPDLLLVHPESGRLLIVELKTDRGRLTNSQKAWIRWLESTLVDVRVWRPSDWDRIETTLRVPAQLSMGADR